MATNTQTAMIVLINGAEGKYIISKYDKSRRGGKLIYLYRRLMARHPIAQVTFAADAAIHCKNLLRCSQYVPE